jgi:hypothetical protein
MKPDSTACDDHNACTIGEYCTTGTCGSGTVKKCDAADACHESAGCDPATGNCTYTPRADGTACPGGACKAGKCESGCGCSGSGASAMALAGLLGVFACRVRRGRARVE